MVSRVLTVQMNKICDRSIGSENDSTGHPKRKTKMLETRGWRLHFVPDLELRAGAVDGCFITYQGRCVGRNGRFRLESDQGHKQSVDPKKYQTIIFAQHMAAGRCPWVGPVRRFMTRSEVGRAAWEVGQNKDCIRDWQEREVWVGESTSRSALSGVLTLMRNCIDP